LRTLEITYRLRRLSPARPGIRRPRRRQWPHCGRHPRPLTQTAAKFWRYPPGTRGKRHAEHVQEEIFVVLKGTAKIDLGDPPEEGGADYLPDVP
jgi:mannose-6-phosphate isomerase-like protein (cupin superfamily)